MLENSDQGGGEEKEEERQVKNTGVDYG